MNTLCIVNLFLNFPGGVPYQFMNLFLFPSHKNLQTTVYVDSSSLGFGIYLSDGQIYSGVWDSNLKQNHINFLELKRTNTIMMFDKMNSCWAGGFKWKRAYYFSVTDENACFLNFCRCFWRIFWVFFGVFSRIFKTLLLQSIFSLTP